MWNIYFSLIFKYTTEHTKSVSLLNRLLWIHVLLPSCRLMSSLTDGRMIDLAGQFQFSGFIIHIIVDLSAFSSCGFGSSLSIVLLCFQRSKVYFDVPLYHHHPQRSDIYRTWTAIWMVFDFFQIVTKKKGYFGDGISENRLEEAQDWCPLYMKEVTRKRWRDDGSEL